MDLRISQTRHKFLFGCNIFKLGRCRTAEDNAAYEKQFAELLNFATLPFYWWHVRAAEGPALDEARTEEIVRWCNAHGVTTKGHPLAWNYVDPALAGQRHARGGRCSSSSSESAAAPSGSRASIDIWDVVNEATPTTARS